MPTYVLDDERWNILHEDTRLVIRTGPVGGAFTERIRKFVTAAQAAVQLDKLIAEKQAAGWQAAGELDADPVEPGNASAEPREPELEHAIAENPDDPAAYQVYGDWLQHRGHPRGELIALQCAEAARPRDRKCQIAVERHLAAHAGVLLGALSEITESADADTLAWRFGFIARLRLLASSELDPEQTIDALARHPSGRFLDEVELRGFEPRQAGRAVAALARVTPALRTLVIVTPHLISSRGPRISELEPLTRLERLRSLTLNVRRGEGMLDAATLRVLARVPSSLERLHVRFGGEEAWADLAPLFERGDLPALRHLGLRDAGFVDEALAALATAPWASQLETLDLALATPGTAALGQLCAERARYPALRRFVVSGDRVRGHTMASLRQAFPFAADVRVDPEDASYDEELEDDRDGDRYDGIRE